MRKKEIKLKKCRVCGKKFAPSMSLDVSCSPLCAFELLNEKKAKAKAKPKAKTRGNLVEEVQVEFNKFLRQRDARLPCISCGTTSNVSFHAGHYRSVGSSCELRFNEDNCHKQCEHCNIQLGGNIHEYREGLLSRIGSERLAKLEGPHPLNHYSHSDLLDLKKHYRAMARDIEKQAA